MKKTTAKTEKTVNEVQKLSATKGRAMLEWYGKRAPKSIEWFPAQEKEFYGDTKAKDWNKLFWGDNKQVLAHLLKEYRGEVDLIYIDPPFDSKADYVKKINLRGQEIQGIEQGLIEEMQYTDMWEKDEYLQFMYERLVIMRELLSDNGCIYLHCDYREVHRLKLMMDEVFGEENFLNSLVWMFSTRSAIKTTWKRTHNDILFYKKSKTPIFNWKDESVLEPLSESTIAKYKFEDDIGKYRLNGRNVKGSPIKSAKDVDPKYEITNPEWVVRDYLRDGKSASDYFFIEIENQASSNRTNYPTQKPEELLYKLISASTKEGGLVLDCFAGSGTTLAVAQKLNRRWIGCDINKGSIITTTERLNKILKEQKNGSAFKVFNVNHYDVFSNDIQAKQLIIESYKIEGLSRGDFDGTLGSDFVKIISPNRVLSKMDIVQVIDTIKKNISLFTAKIVSKQKEATFNNKVVVICSGAELDVRDFTKKDNSTGVTIEIRDIQVDKKDLDFKKPTEASISYKVKGFVLTIDVKDYYSPLLMKRLELENDGRLSAKERVNLFDYRQAIEHIVIDVNYGEGQKKSKDIAFNAEAFLHKAKKNELVDISYTHTYEKKGTYTVAVKIVDVLGEEYFETHEITLK